MKVLITKIFSKLGFEVKRKKRNSDSSNNLKKADGFIGRYREVVGYPLNLLIERIPMSGCVDNQGLVVLHNGLRVPQIGKYAYYGDFSDLLTINKGVHEPLEEFCFQELLKLDPGEDCNILELGAYWAHYSMWFLSKYPDARSFLVEPDRTNIKAGKNNFAINGFAGTFLNRLVARDQFTVDKFLGEYGLKRLYLLHSDIQGQELEMLQHARNSLQNDLIDYVFLSTHSESLHESCLGNPPEN